MALAVDGTAAGAFLATMSPPAGTCVSSSVCVCQGGGGWRGRRTGRRSEEVSPVARTARDARHLGVREVGGTLRRTHQGQVAAVQGQVAVAAECEG